FQFWRELVSTKETRHVVCVDVRVTPWTRFLRYRALRSCRPSADRRKNGEASGKARCRRPLRWLRPLAPPEESEDEEDGDDRSDSHHDRGAEGWPCHVENRSRTRLALLNASEEPRAPPIRNGFNEPGSSSRSRTTW